MNAGTEATTKETATWTEIPDGTVTVRFTRADGSEATVRCLTLGHAWALMAARETRAHYMVEL